MRCGRAGRPAALRPSSSRATPWLTSYRSPFSSTHTRARSAGSTPATIASCAATSGGLLRSDLVEHWRPSLPSIQYETAPSTSMSTGPIIALRRRSMAACSSAERTGLNRLAIARSWEPVATTRRCPLDVRATSTSALASTPFSKPRAAMVRAASGVGRSHQTGYPWSSSSQYATASSPIVARSYGSRRPRRGSAEDLGFVFMSFALRGAPCGNYPHPTPFVLRHHDDQQTASHRHTDVHGSRLSKRMGLVWPTTDERVVKNGSRFIEANAPEPTISPVFLRIPSQPGHRTTVASVASPPLITVVSALGRVHGLHLV
jgi:hypothetical protein